MITEDYISFETAKLLKEKGFNEYCRAFRSPSSIGSKGLFYSVNEVKNIEEKKTLGSAVACPTLQMAMKWLREVHNIVCNITIERRNFYYYSIFIIRSSIEAQYQLTSQKPYFGTYEEAAEAAIKYCLENLI